MLKRTLPLITTPFTSRPYRPTSHHHHHHNHGPHLPILRSTHSHLCTHSKPLQTSQIQTSRFHSHSLGQYNSSTLSGIRTRTRTPTQTRPSLSLSSSTTFTSHIALITTSAKLCAATSPFTTSSSSLSTTTTNPISDNTNTNTKTNMSSNPQQPKINPITKLLKTSGAHVVLQDPFIFFAYHDDKYPVATAKMGPATGGDYQMYHTETEVPGFPNHPHFGFETITIVEKGNVDHADSLGNMGRYSSGDVQWLTTGNGVQHSEMFPLLDMENPNPQELFQVWLNQPPELKRKDSDYKMLWREDIPRITLETDPETGIQTEVQNDQNGQNGQNDQNGQKSSNPRTNVRILSGSLALPSGSIRSGLPRPPFSYSTPDQNNVNVYLIKVEEGGKLVIPKKTNTVNRTLVAYTNPLGFALNGHSVPAGRYQLNLHPESDIEIVVPVGDGHGKEKGEVRFIWLEGEPIGHPVVQHGPFVTNSREQLGEVFQRYQRTEFGGWPWGERGPVFSRETPRIATFEGGKRTEKPGQN